MNDTTLPISKTSTSSRRGKVVIKKGFALYDWKRLLRSSNDLAQRKGMPLRPITAEEIATHKKIFDGWMILHGKVYNIGPYLHYHPGGVEIMESCLGGDGSELFDKYHQWVNVQSLIGPLLIGYLAESRSKAMDTHLTKDANGITKESEFSVPAPRPTTTKSILPLLSNVSRTDDDKEEIVNPWEK